MIVLSVGIGLILSFLCTEFTGLSAGLIVPGYLALYLDQPIRIAATLAVALLAYLAVLALSNLMILYGRRRFMAAVLIGFWLGWLAARLAGSIPLASQDVKVIGYIIPGLIANEAIRHGPVKTIAAVLLVSALTRLILHLV